MKCTDNEWKHCQEEKRGCKGCYYNDLDNLLEELTKVRPEMLNEEALKLFNTIMAILDERDELIEVNKELEKENKELNSQIQLLEQRLKEKICFEGHQQFMELQKNSIPISAVKEKIKEYDSIGQMGVVRSLQELLKESED